MLFNRHYLHARMFCKTFISGEKPSRRPPGVPGGIKIFTSPLGVPDFGRLGITAFIFVQKKSRISLSSQLAAGWGALLWNHKNSLLENGNFIYFFFLLHGRFGFSPQSLENCELSDRDSRALDLENPVR